MSEIIGNFYSHCWFLPIINLFSKEIYLEQYQWYFRRRAKNYRWYWWKAESACQKVEELASKREEELRVRKEAVSIVENAKETAEKNKSRDPFWSHSRSSTFEKKRNKKLHNKEEALNSIKGDGISLSILPANCWANSWCWRSTPTDRSLSWWIEKPNGQKATDGDWEIYQPLFNWSLKGRTRSSLWKLTQTKAIFEGDLTSNLAHNGVEDEEKAKSQTFSTLWFTGSGATN